MRLGTAALAVIIGISLSGCMRREEPPLERDTSHEPAARKAGHAAYGLAQETEAAAKKAARELGKATHEARQGWNDAKHEAKQKPRE